MSHPNKAKGDRYEREAAELLTRLSPWVVERTYGAGRNGDVGDLRGLPRTVVQVKAWSNLAAAIRAGLDGAEVQRYNARELYGVAMIRRPKVRGRCDGDQWVVCMSPATFVRLLDSALVVADD
jgi:hypothetical protein